MSEDRCRLVLMANPGLTTADKVTELVASSIPYCVILYAGDSNPKDFSDFCEKILPSCKQYEIPALIADDTQVMGRNDASGLLVTRQHNQLATVIERFSPERIIGCGGLKNRHAALEAGEANPDFVMFGKLGGDVRAETHPKNLSLAEWWSEVLEIPCIVLAGNQIESILDCANTGADFVAVEKCIFEHAQAPMQALEAAEALLEKHAPRFEEVAA